MMSPDYFKSFYSPGKAFVVSLLFFLSFYFDGQAADTTYSLVASDSAFTMTVARVKNEVVITLYFDHNIDFEYLSIERKVDWENNFSQCKYITYDEVKQHDWILVKKEKYPYSAQSDMLYRVKYVTKEGVMRIFPSLFLPAVKD